jgi:cytochrome c oxidase subunit II
MMILRCAKPATSISTIAITAILSACGGTRRQSALDSVGVQADKLESLWWIFFAVCAVVYVAVIAAILVAYFRRERADSNTAPDSSPNPGQDRRLSNVVKVCVAISLIALFGLMITSFGTGREIHALSEAKDPLVIKITGHQWWWEVEYQDADPSKNVLTANEIHVPVGRPIKLLLQSNDVIHSFWLPNLHGKKDLIPNYPTTFFFQADEPGEYTGQCAEFCGYQHAKMRFIVTAETPEEFDTWYSEQQKPGKEPVNESQKRGREIFLTGVCTQCHSVQGTIANARFGPNLTHVGSKPYIASASLHNTRENLEQWVTDPHRFKPGIRMPMNAYSDEDLKALVDYLENLK